MNFLRYSVVICPFSHNYLNFDDAFTINTKCVPSIESKVLLNPLKYSVAIEAK